MADRKAFPELLFFSLSHVAGFLPIGLKLLHGVGRILPVHALLDAFRLLDQLFLDLFILAENILHAFVKDFPGLIEGVDRFLELLPHLVVLLFPGKTDLLPFFPNIGDLFGCLVPMPEVFVFLPGQFLHPRDQRFLLFQVFFLILLQVFVVIRNTFVYDTNMFPEFITDFFPLMLVGRSDLIPFAYVGANEIPDFLQIPPSVPGLLPSRSGSVSAPGSSSDRSPLASCKC